MNFGSVFKKCIVCGKASVAVVNPHYYDFKAWFGGVCKPHLLLYWNDNQVFIDSLNVLTSVKKVPKDA